MAKPNDGGPAFPRNQAAGDPFKPGGEIWLAERGMIQEGMSLRDWFAAHALQTMFNSDSRLGISLERARHISESAYIIADAMLKQREEA